MEIGIYTFADIGKDSVTGQVITAGQRMRNLMEEIELADQAGLDVFAIGEHHRPDYAVSAPAVVLGAAAVRTKNIRLSSALSFVLPSSKISRKDCRGAKIARSKEAIEIASCFFHALESLGQLCCSAVNMIKKWKFNM